MPGTGHALADDHTVLVWQTCAFAEEVREAARSGQRVTPPLDALLEFLQYRLLPYLREEERHLAPGGPGGEQLARLQLVDHDRLRAAAAELESSRTRQLLVAACDALVDGLDRHVRREERWLVDGTAG